MKQWNITLDDTDAIEALPKLKTAIELEDGKRELFWGLLVKEKRSDLMVLIYMTIFNIPSLLFFFLWLFLWGHDSDLQNASVPALTSMSLTIGFVGWLYSTPGSGVR